MRKAHEDVGLISGGHDFHHALRVGQMAILVAWEESQRMAKLAGAAGLCHNADRILERQRELKCSNVSSIDEESVRALTRIWLRFLGFTNEERDLVTQAVVHHGTKPNALTDSLVLMALADADRLVNMEPDVIIRSGQHHHDIPALDPVYFEAVPGANYRDPKTVLWDIANCITWALNEGPYILRLPKARELGKERAAYLQNFIDTIKRQHSDLGLVPYPSI